VGCFAANADHCSTWFYNYMGARRISSRWRSYMGRTKRRVVNSSPRNLDEMQVVVYPTSTRSFCFSSDKAADQRSYSATARPAHLFFAALNGVLRLFSVLMYKKNKSFSFFACPCFNKVKFSAEHGLSASSVAM
jgi:hypothetical protein